MLGNGGVNVNILVVSSYEANEGNPVIKANGTKVGSPFSSAIAGKTYVTGVVEAGSI